MVVQLDKTKYACKYAHTPVYILGARYLHNAPLLNFKNGKCIVFDTIS